MKKIHALWLDSDEEKFHSLKKLYNAKNFIGFVPVRSPKLKYMICVGGSSQGVAINCMGSWTNKEEQADEEGEYFVFESAFDLYTWLANEDN